MRPAYQRETEIRRAIADADIAASSGWICCENSLLVSQAGCFDASHSEHASARCRRDVFGTLGANQAKLVVGRLRREGVYWTFGLAGFSFSSFSAA